MIKNRQVDLLTLNELKSLLNKSSLNPSNKFTKSLSNARVSYILDILGAEKVANLLLSTFITVVSNKDDLDLCNQLDLNVLLGKRLFNLVLKSLYAKYMLSFAEEKGVTSSSVLAQGLINDGVKLLRFNE
jgi:hypothetical protein